MDNLRWYDEPAVVVSRMALCGLALFFALRSAYLAWHTPPVVLPLMMIGGIGAFLAADIWRLWRRIMAKAS